MSEGNVNKYMVYFREVSPINGERHMSVKASAIDFSDDNKLCLFVREVDGDDSIVAIVNMRDVVVITGPGFCVESI